MSFEPREYLQHILAEADYLVTHSRDLAPETFQADETLRRAFVRSLEIIGEAANQVSQELCERAPEIPWSKIVSMRNRLIHAYSDVNIGLVWSTVVSDLPALISQLEGLLAADG